MRIKAKDPLLISLIGTFLNQYLPFVKNRDKDTVDSYRYSINIYLEYLSQTKGLTLKTVASADFSQANIVVFLGWLKTERKNVASTVNHRLSDVRSFCRFLAKKKAISDEAYEEIREIEEVPDERVEDFTWLTITDVRDILESTSGPKDHIRNRFLLSLLYESGARIDEILSLKLQDFKPTKEGEVDVHFFGKGKKHRVTPLSKEIWRQYNLYCKKYHLEERMEELLFYSKRNNEKHKMSKDNVSRILNDCEKTVRAKNPNLLHLHAHLFRRSRAMHLYQAGMPLPTISDWLGHSNIETTRFYAKVTSEMKREAIQKLAESNNSVFKDDVAFKYAEDEEVLKRLCGLK